MNKEFYRFRRISSLLGDFKELESQSIFFAEPSTLNDPMEGFRDIYWKGDFIVWRNLFRHYLLCLERLCSIYTISGEEHPVSELDIPVFAGEDDFPTQMYRDLFSSICNGFLEDKHISCLIELIASRTTPIRRDELEYYLGVIHPFALELIFSTYEEKGLLHKQDNKKVDTKKQLLYILEHNFIGTIEKELEESNNPEVIQAIFSANKNIKSQMELICCGNGRFDTTQKSKLFIIKEFTEKYISRIEKLVFPNWYTACFMSECRNSSVWGHYGENHTGVCLIFNAEIIDEKPKIKLNTPVGYSSSGTTYSYISHEFHPVDYIQGHGNIDFFRMLGRLPIPTLNSMWYSFNGKMSVCSDDMIGSEKVWREKYWVNFYRDIVVKSKDWAYENEHRIIVTSSLDSFEAPKDRALNYEFSSLKGIIFGVNTKFEDKLEIMKIIERKCIENNRDNFEFHQAYYSHADKCINHTKLDLLRFKKETSSTA